MSSYFLMYEFISCGAMCEVLPSLWWHRCPARLSGAADILCSLPSPNRTRIDFGGGNLVWGWQKRRNQSIIRRAVDYEEEPAQGRRSAGAQRVRQGQ